MNAESTKVDANSARISAESAKIDATSAARDTEDDIVITGMSGRFPDSDNVEELAEQLYAGVDMVTDDDRGYPAGPDLRSSCGRLKNLSHFDATYFKVNAKQAHVMEPQLRKLLEVIHEAIIDAGINPAELRGPRTAVLIGVSNCDAMVFWTRNIDSIIGYEFIDTSPGMFASRINYSFDFQGPSNAIDSGCNSTFAALSQAQEKIKMGVCDAVIVAGSSLKLSPGLTYALKLLGALSPTGRCRTFDVEAEGFVRSDSMVALILQKRRSARRIYASLRGIETQSEGYKAQGITFPSTEVQRQLANKVYEKARLNPLDVVYLEAHGTGTKVGDIEEVAAVAEVFCQGRKSPLPIGSVKTNIGHTEAVSGLCSIVKMLLAMERGVIPGNLQYNVPNPKIPALMDGRVKVVTCNTLWEGGLVAINNFGFGSCSHAILESSRSTRPLPAVYAIPRLIISSGRTKEAVKTLLSLANAHSKDAELHAMIDAVHSLNMPGHPYRGYALLGDQYSEEISIESDNSKCRPIWFVFTEFDYQWLGLGRFLLQLPVFVESVKRSAAIVRPHGIDLQHILIENQEDIDVLNATVGLVALHVALVDVLKTIEIHPDGIIGYGIGEIGCGYADGSLTAEQAILCAYWCGCSFMETKTISDAAPLLKKKLQYLIPNPKPRSSKWLSSLPRDKENNFEFGNLCSAEYYQNSIKTKLTFVDALQVPDRAILVELGPTSELSLKLEASLFIPLIDGDGDFCNHLLKAFGKIYNAGAQPQVGKLYPLIQWPVSRGTPGLSSHIRWDHSKKWNVPFIGHVPKVGNSVIKFDSTKADNVFITGYNIDGRILYPATGYLIIIWRTLARMYNRKLEDTPVVFENVTFKKTVRIDQECPVKFEGIVNRLSCEFIVYEDDNIVASGTIRMANDQLTRRYEMSQDIANCNALLVTSTDIYKDLRLRGYNYSGIFKGIQSSHASLQSGLLSWNDNWISFIDTMLQFDIMGRQSRNLCLPGRIQRLVIDPKTHISNVKNQAVAVYRDINIIFTKGIEIQGIRWNLEKRCVNLHKEPKLEKYVFLPYESKQVVDDVIKSQDTLTACLQIVIENTIHLRLKIAEVTVGRKLNTLLLPDILKIIESEPQIRAEAILAVEHNLLEYKEALKESNVEVLLKNVKRHVPSNECHLVMGVDLMTHQNAVCTFKKLGSALCDTGMLLIKNSLKFDNNHKRLDYIFDRSGLTVIFRQSTEKCEYVLLRRKPKIPRNGIIIEITEDYSWMNRLRVSMSRNVNNNIRIYLVSYAYDSGILGLFKNLQKEASGRNLRVFLLPGAVLSFAPNKIPYQNQVEKDLVVNIFRYEVWGTYRHLLLEDCPIQEVNEAFVNASPNGDLSSLRWTQSPSHPAILSTSDAELCQVHYAAINSCDVIKVTGNSLPQDQPSDPYKGECALGTEFSGCLPSGKRVMGIVKAKGLATTVVVDPKFLWEIPKTWSLEEAATVPVAFVTAYYALFVRGNMALGESVLIHNGASDVGQAAITLAFHAGCSVFVTAETADKREFLCSRYLELKSNIGKCDTSFEQMVLQNTAGRGVDLIFNLLGDDKLFTSNRYLADGGRFLHLNEFGQSNDVVMPAFSNKSFHIIDIKYLSDLEKSIISLGLRDILLKGIVYPLPTTVYSMQQLQEAFRKAMQNQMYKVLIRIQSEEILTNGTKLRTVSAVPRTYMHPDKSYILVGGLGGVGLELSQWLVARGATKLIFATRSGVKTGYQSWCIKRLKEKGIEILVLTDDVTILEGAEVILNKAADLGPVGGIFNLAEVVREKLFENQSEEDFVNVLKPKVAGTKALDLASRNLAPELDHFVVFSSFFSCRGGHGQSNYGMANSAMERIVERRKAYGLPGLAIQWGSIGGVGMIAEQKTHSHESGVVLGTEPQPIQSCLEMLDKLLPQSNAVVASCIVADKQVQRKQDRTNLRKRLAKILGVADFTKIPQTTTLVDLGMDSLMSAEILHMLEKDYDIWVGIDDLNRITFSKLRKLEEEVTEVSEATEVKEKVSLNNVLGAANELVF